jgi:hypothetical protein
MSIKKNLNEMTQDNKYNLKQQLNKEERVCMDKKHIHIGK